MPRLADRTSHTAERREGTGAPVDTRADAQFVVRSDVRAERARVVRDQSSPGSTRADVAKGPQHATPHREAVQRLLVPVDATERSRWPLRYALAHSGTPLHVDLLFVAEPVTRLEVLRFRTQAEIADLAARDDSVQSRL